MNSQIPTETELIDALGVGRSTVREAVRSLAHVGMLETARGRGTFVRALSPVDRVLTDYLQEHEPRDIVEVRRALEVEAAGLAALRRTEADIAALRPASTAPNGWTRRSNEARFLGNSTSWWCGQRAIRCLRTCTPV